jgi:hypothetical protein
MTPAATTGVTCSGAVFGRLKIHFAVSFETLPLPIWVSGL